MTGLLTYGETMACFAQDGTAPLAMGNSLRLTMAGAESNAALAVRRLGQPARWVGVVGADPFGIGVQRCLRGEGILTDGIRVEASAPTGLLVKEHRRSRATYVWYYRAGSAGSRLAPGDVVAAHLDSADVLLITGITPALSDSALAAVRAAVAGARRRELTVVFDVNYRRQLWSADAARPVLRELIAAADIVFATSDEAEVVLDEHDVTADRALRALADLTAADVVLKAGSAGATALIDGQLHVVPAHAVQVVDPVGAGDAFVGGTIADLIAGAALLDALHTGAVVAALAVSGHGDWESLPDRGDVAAARRGAEDITR